MSSLVLDPRPLRPGVLTPPQSKSDAQRALLLAHIVGWKELESTIDSSARRPRDVRLMAEGLAALRGAQSDRPVDIECMDGGAPFRFLLGQAAIAPATCRFTGTPRLGERPRQPLLDALEAALGPSGLKIDAGAPWPVTIQGVGDARRADPVFRIDSRESSQFATSLLIAAAALQRRESRPWSVELVGRSASAGYLQMTLSWLERTGFAVEAEGQRLTLAGWSAPTTVPNVPGDWSSLAYLLLIAWESEGSVSRLDRAMAHPDRAILRLLGTIGLSVETSAEGATRVLGRAQGGLRASAAECPDLIPTLAALACALPEVSRFEDVGILRDKESDRREGIRALVAAAGGTTVVGDGTLSVEPPRGRPSFLDVDSRGDHRLAMSAATLACLLGVTLRVTDPDCVEKSFPGFWDELAGAGASVRRTG